MGGMDGIFACYHNTIRAFGFQYFPLDEINEYVFGNSKFSQEAYNVCFKLLQTILDHTTPHFAGKDYRIIFSFDPLVSNRTILKCSEIINGPMKEFSKSWAITVNTFVNSEAQLLEQVDLEEAPDWNIEYVIDEIVDSKS